MYDITKERGANIYYVVYDGERVSAPFKDKKAAARLAAKMNGMTMKEFMKERKQNDTAIHKPKTSS